LSLENICHLESQRVNGKSGYTSFIKWMESTVKGGIPEEVGLANEVNVGVATMATLPDNINVIGDSLGQGVATKGGLSVAVRQSVAGLAAGGRHDGDKGTGGDVPGGRVRQISKMFANLDEKPFQDASAQPEVVLSVPIVVRQDMKGEEGRLCTFEGETPSQFSSIEEYLVEEDSWRPSKEEEPETSRTAEDWQGWRDNCVIVPSVSYQVMSWEQQEDKKKVHKKEDSKKTTQIEPSMDKPVQVEQVRVKKITRRKDKGKDGLVQQKIEFFLFREVV
jgi:hypothetical protein